MRAGTAALIVSALYAGLLHPADSLSHGAPLLRPATGVPLVSTRRSSAPLLSTQDTDTQPRWRAALPGGGDALDREIMGAALPSIANLAVIPIVGAVDTFWIGRMGNALALAGQGAANQIFFSAFFLIAFIPTITAPLVARAAGSGDIDGACTRVCEALFLANALGLLGTLFLVLRPHAALSLVLPAGAPAAEYAVRYLRLRSISLIPALVSAIGFAAFRGMLDTVTPLKVSLASNALNLVLDPLLIFGAKLGVAGAAIATAASEVGAGALYGVLLLRRRLLRPNALLRPPELAALLPLLRGGSALLLRQLAINVAFVTATRMTQAMDATGVSAAAYSITNQIYSLGVVVMLAMQGTGATLVPAALARSKGEDGGGVVEARRVADRLIGWSTAIAASMALVQAVAAPWLAPLFSTLPEVRAAVRGPALASALVQLTNGPLFAGEGIMMGVGAFGPLAILTAVGVAVMVGGLTLSARFGLGVSSVWFSLLGFHLVQLFGTMFFHLRLGPLADGASQPSADAPAGRAQAESVDCVEVPGVGEVCVTGDADASEESLP